jgi:uncharacterized protein YlxW (UPF0749 family)
MTDPRGPQGSMSLLVDMTAASLDPGYAAAAARRGSRLPGPGRRLSRGVVSGLVLVGLGTGVAAAQTRERAAQTDAVRSSLRTDVQERTRTTDALAAEAGELRAQVRTLRDQALAADARGTALAQLVSDLELATAAVAVRGPGLEVMLNDAQDADDGTSPRGGQASDGRIYDRDLQEVVNALWVAGAEAVSVNGMRLSAQTAIRSAGEAILVDLRPLSPPYVLRAVGDPDRMEPAFVDGATARKFQTWTSLYGLRFKVRRQADLQLPAAASPSLLHARNAPPTPSPTPTGVSP